MTRKLGVTRVAIVEDHTLFAESLDVALTLEGHDVHRIAIDEGASSSTSVLAAVLRVRPRVVLLDLGLGEACNGVHLIEPVARSGAVVVVVTSATDRAVWGECLHHGASTVLSKAQPLNAILSTIRHIGEGRAVMPREQREQLTAGYLSTRVEMRELRRRMESLTPRERQVLAHLMAGRAVREIAHLGVVSEATVRTQVKSILAKLDVSSQLAAVGAAHRAGIHPAPTGIAG